MKVILIDEDTDTLDHLMYKLSGLHSVEVVGVYTNSIIGKEVVKRTDIDLLFLAINQFKWPIVERIKQAKPELPIVLLAHNGEHAVKAFEMNVFDYIVKPVQSNRLRLTMERIKQENPIKQGQAAKNHIQLNLFGEFSIVKYTANTTETILLHWRTKKTEQLFLFLIHHENKLIEKAEIIDMLWRDVAIDRAYEQLYVTIYHVRQALKPLSEYITIKSKLDCYVVTLDNVKIDNKQFDAFFIKNLHLSTENIAEYEAVLALNDNLLLRNHDYIWLIGPQQKYEVQWLQMACLVMEYYGNEEEFYKGKDLANLVCDRFPFEEVGYFYLMKYNAHLGQHHGVEKAYHALKTVTWEELQAYPSERVVKWYYHWKKQQGFLTKNTEVEEMLS